MEQNAEIIVQVKAYIPQTLKRQCFSILAARGQSFSGWLREEMEQLILHAAQEALTPEGLQAWQKSPRLHLPKNRN